MKCFVICSLEKPCNGSGGWLSRRPGFNYRPVHIAFAVYRETLGEVILRALGLHASIITPMIQSHAFITDTAVVKVILCRTIVNGIYVLIRQLGLNCSLCWLKHVYCCGLLLGVLYELNLDP